MTPDRFHPGGDKNGKSNKFPIQNKVNQIREATMAMRSGMYSSSKRKKELMRQKKQEEKRLRRQKNVKAASQGPETDPANAAPESTVNAAEPDAGQVSDK